MPILLQENGHLILQEDGGMILLEGMQNPPFAQGLGLLGLSYYLTSELLPTLQTLRIENIFDYEKSDIEGYPAATVTGAEIPGKVLDNTRNMRIIRFVIRIFIDRNKQNLGGSQAEFVARSVSDELMLRIDGDPTLGGNCINAIPFGARLGYIERLSNNIRVIEVTLDCQIAITWR